MATKEKKTDCANKLNVRAKYAVKVIYNRKTRATYDLHKIFPRTFTADLVSNMLFLSKASIFHVTF